MTELMNSVHYLSDAELLQRIKALVLHECTATAELIAHLAEFDSRRLFLKDGSASLFGYCTRILHLSEYAAYHRIKAARYCRRFPVLFARIADGSLNLSALVLIGPHLNDRNLHEVITKSVHKSKREIEVFVAGLRPLPDAKTLIRRLPDPGEDQAHHTPDPAAPLKPAGDPLRRGVSATPDSMATNTRVLEPSGMVMPPGTKPGAETQFAPTDTNQLPSDVAPPPNATTSNTQGPSSRATITPLAPERYRIQFTAGVGTYQKLIRARDLLRHQVPDGNPVVIFDRALTTLIIEIEKRRFAETLRPRRPIVAGRAVRRPAAGGAWRLTRHIPAEVKRLVWKRDAGRCAFVFPDGNRCEEEGWLEYHHLQPFSLGGEATVDNLELRCRSHNQYEADLVFKPPVRLVEKG